MRHLYVTYASRMRHVCVTYMSHMRHVCVTCASPIRHVASRMRHLSVTYAARTYHVCITYASRMRQVCVTYPSHMRHVCVTYASPIHHVCVTYAFTMPYSYLNATTTACNIRHCSKWQCQSFLAAMQRKCAVVDLKSRNGIKRAIEPLLTTIKRLQEKRGSTCWHQWWLQGTAIGYMGARLSFDRCYSSPVGYPTPLTMLWSNWGAGLPFQLLQSLLVAYSGTTAGYIANINLFIPRSKSNFQRISPPH